MRVACKIIGKVSNTKLINDIKPKVLSNFIIKSLEVKIPAKHSDDDKSKIKVIQLSEFI